MSDLITLPRATVQQALEALEKSETWVPDEGFGMLRREAERKHEAAIAALRAALEQPEQEPHWLTKELMADYLDMVAEAIDNNSGQMLRDKAYWLLRRVLT